MTDFDHATDADRERARLSAQNAGWWRQGNRYSHPTRGHYLVKDMDGWIDLCDNEGIHWNTRIIPCPACGGDKGHHDFADRWSRCVACDATGDAEIELEAIEMEDLEDAHG